MPKLLFASKTIEYDGTYGNASRKYEIRLSNLDGIYTGTRERKVLFGLIKKQERYIEIRTHGIQGIDAPIVYSESEEGRDEYNMLLEKAKQFAGNNEIKIERI